MNLIRRVQVRYFRSIHAVDVKDCQSVNVISGRNDVGKSNFLKALNLFFNGETGWKQPFSFISDFSHKRREQVRKETVKGKQFISIGIEFERPTNYKKSLPPKFTVTRTWFRDSELYDQRDDLGSRALPGKLKTAQRSLTSFLNKIRYLYVPAVKDRAYFDHLFSNLQEELLNQPLDNTEFKQLASTLARTVQRQVVHLTKEFEEATGIVTSIQPPSESAKLFQAFTVSTSSQIGPIPLAFHGDGIQARYVPSVLNYFSSRTRRFFIWGFEEPENSLEYSRAAQLAADFAKTYAEKAQIFVTTHSPAFISIENQNANCYRAFADDGATNIVAINRFAGGKNKEILEEEIGLLELQKGVHRQYEKEKLEREDITKKFKELKAQGSRPLLFVEGKFDKHILSVAWIKLFPKRICPFDIETSDSSHGKDGGNGNAHAVRTLMEACHPAIGRQYVGLFDRDHEGIKEFQNLSKNFVETKRGDVKKHVNGLASAMLLPIPSYRAKHAYAQTLCVELMFTDEVLIMKTREGKGLAFNNPKVKASAIHHGRQDNLPEGAVTYESKDLEHFRSIDETSKGVFAADIVPNLKSEHFSSFAPLFETVLNNLHLRHRKKRNKANEKGAA